MKYDYLKYWRVVRYWAKVKHGLGVPQLEMLLFLYSEGYFMKKDFDEFNALFKWNNTRFQGLITDRWVVKFRNHGGGKAAIYQLSHKGKGVCKSVYMKLDGEEAFSECRTRIFQTNPKYKEKVYRDYMKKINLELRQRPSQE
jgi:hypothetical protein|tara:strand:+ start:1470 stop:1895 length:426 start_codon:yes stop_codon:yes gene_type:complete